MSDTIEPRIVCAAIRNSEGDVICGARHFDQIMRRQIANTEQEWRTAEQGFIDQRGNFLTRKQAFVVAYDAGQIIRRVGGDDEKLFSENIY